MIVFFCCRVLHSRDEKGKKKNKTNKNAKVERTGNELFCSFYCAKGTTCSTDTPAVYLFISNDLEEMQPQSMSSVKERRQSVFFSLLIIYKGEKYLGYRRGSPRSFSVLSFLGEQFQSSPLHFLLRQNRMQTRTTAQLFSF